ncbi:MAG: ImuA family protein [Phycisphaerales bacterium JB037]
MRSLLPEQPPPGRHASPQAPPQPPAPHRLSRLAEQVEQIEQRSNHARRTRAGIPTGWDAIDHALGGLARGSVHEWFGTLDPDHAPRHAATRTWHPPLTLMLHLAGATGPRAGSILWIGRRSWPSPLAMTPDLLDRSVFIDAPDASARVWAIDTSLRCPGIALVIADASRLTMPASRRLQLAAQEGGAPGLLLRPSHELAQLSAAATRWLVRTNPAASSIASPITSPTWTLELLRCKHRAPAAQDDSRWTVQLRPTVRHEPDELQPRESHPDHHEPAQTGDVHLVPEPRDRSAPPTRHTPEFQLLRFG